MEITKEQFMRYEAVRQSGVTNMWDTRRVARLTGLDRTTVLEIIKHYPELKAKYSEKTEHKMVYIKGHWSRRKVKLTERR